MPAEVTGGGLSDPRSGLAFDMVRLSYETGAGAVILENVAGMTDHGVAAMLTRSFEREGFAVFSRVLDAADFGVPQHRSRLFFVALASRRAAAAFRWPSPTHGPDTPCPHVALSTVLPEVPYHRPAPTVTATEHKAAPRFGLRGGGQRPRRCLDRLTVALGCPVRLAPEALALVQGFPPGFSFTGDRPARYRQVGNAVPPPLGLAVAAAVRLALRAEASGHGNNEEAQG